MAESDAAGRKFRSELDARFSSLQPAHTDSRTSRQLTQAMEDESLLAIAKPPVGQDIRCRGDLCRMEFIFTDRAEADDWVTFYTPLTGEDIARTQFFVERSGDGLTTVIAYGFKR